MSLLHLAYDNIYVIKQPNEKENDSQNDNINVIIKPDEPIEKENVIIQPNYNINTIII